VTGYTTDEPLCGHAPVLRVATGRRPRKTDGSLPRHFRLSLRLGQAYRGASSATIHSVFTVLWDHLARSCGNPQSIDRTARATLKVLICR
jgi:hypothetical protein